MNKVIKFVVLLFCASQVSCSSDEPGDSNNPGSGSENNTSVTIKSDGSTSNGVMFSPIDDTTFFLDYIKYKIVDSHLEIVGYDPIEIAEDVVPYATVTYRGVKYTTRVVDKYAFSNCKRMLTCKLPNSLTYIDKGAFSNCWNLTSLEIPATVYTCHFHPVDFNRSRTNANDSYPFYACSSLSKIKLVGEQGYEDNRGLILALTIINDLYHRHVINIYIPNRYVEQSESFMNDQYNEYFWFDSSYIKIIGY